MADTGKRAPTRPRQKLPKGRTVQMPRRDHQPSKAEMEEEFDMPGGSIETVRRAFFRPITVETDEAE